MSAGDPPGVALAQPSPRHLASYIDALQRGWSADNVRGAVAAREELARIDEDAPAFLVKPPQFGSAPGLRYRIALQGSALA